MLAFNMRNWWIEYLTDNETYDQATVASVEQALAIRNLRYVSILRNFSTIIIFIVMPLVFFVLKIEPDTNEYSIYYKLYGIIYMCLVVYMNKDRRKTTRDWYQRIPVKHRFWIYNSTGYQLTISPIFLFFFGLFMLLFIHATKGLTDYVMMFVIFSFYYMSSYALYFSKYFPVSASESGVRKTGYIPMIFIIWEMIIMFLNLNFILSISSHLVYAAYLGLSSRKRMVVNTAGS